jgi:hypothetical protein
MEINPVNPVGLSAPVSTGPPTVPVNLTDRQVVATVRNLNQSELLGQDRELTYRRDLKTGRLVVQILERATGDVVDQIPPEVLLQIGAAFDEQIHEKATAFLAPPSRSG